MSTAFAVPYSLYDTIKRINSKTGFIAFAVIAAFCQIYKRNIIHFSGRMLARMAGDVDHTSMEDGLLCLVRLGIIERNGDIITFLAHDFTKKWSKGNNQFYVPALMLEKEWYDIATMRVIRTSWYLFHAGAATRMYVEKDGKSGKCFFVRSLDPIADPCEIKKDILDHPAFLKIFQVEKAGTGVKNHELKKCIRLKNKYVVERKDVVKQNFCILNGNVRKLLRNIFRGIKFTDKIMAEISAWAGMFGMTSLKFAMEHLPAKYIVEKAKRNDIDNASKYLFACVLNVLNDPMIVV
ncbi:MAG TPA: hypothetical protein VIM51_05285 [Desulfosporosinus sp.]